MLADPGTEDPTPTPVAGWTNKSYSYDDDDHKHAVTDVTVTDANNNQTTNSYKYDENGNMTCRRENGNTYLQAYNAENRMIGVVVYSGDCDNLGGAITQSWIFTNDGDGNKVKQEYTLGTSTLTTYYYAGGSYEVSTDGTTTTVKQYYSIGGMSVGVRSGSTLSYFLADHLGSISAVTDDTGAITSETRYTPFGEVRTDVGTIAETNYGYTNQEIIPSLGLMDYNARMYDSSLGRFIQPDSVVAEPGSTQGLNRFSYVGNNPIKNTDPTGHFLITMGMAVAAMVVGAVIGGVISAHNQKEETGSIDVGKVALAAVEGALIGGAVVLAAMAVSIAVAGITAAIGVGSAAAGAACKDGDCTNEASAASNAVSSILNKPKTSVFWSGGTDVENAANAWAKENGGQTLGMTQEGINVGKFVNGLEWGQAKPYWEDASANFAAKASGKVHVFLSGVYVNPESIWKTVEEPILHMNSEVTKIIAHIVYPN